MENKEAIKFCAVRLPSELHRLVKLKAYEKGLTVQEYIKNILEKEVLTKIP